jgi:hypothetical protein
MEVGLRPAEKSADKPPNPEATTLRFYSTNYSPFEGVKGEYNGGLCPHE